ncbi:uncharacterized protein LOC113231043 [Hyposmocoma kahamanoa]|uniref:uncharacterized protein LOC113231043 n=1 Tax=Hyposmocoma kahamanoa TaxID=1477025 RepID=UPI000E6D5B41|nr:uncharacterized protein LOC113231043 [Hyposmocoma kahamanoa]
MWSTIVTLLTVVTIACTETTVPGISRTFSQGVSSMGYKIIYGDEDMTAFNEVVNDAEKNVLKQRHDSMNGIDPLKAQDVKCLMSVDRYCSEEMGAVKSVLIQALKDDCKACTDQQKTSAGRVIAAMMAHDPTAWKVFLTRSVLQIKKRRKRSSVTSKTEQTNNRYTPNVDFDFVTAEEIENSRNRIAAHGVRVRVRRFGFEKVSNLKDETVLYLDKEVNM